MADIQSVLAKFKDQMAAEEAAKMASAPMPEPVAAPAPVQAPAVEAPKSEPMSAETKQLFAQAILGLAPILAGAAVSGARGGAIGAEAGLGGLKKMESLQEAQRTRERETSKLAQEQSLKNIELALKISGEKRAQTKEEREALAQQSKEVRDQRDFEMRKQKQAFDQNNAASLLGIKQAELKIAQQKAERGEEQKLNKLTAQQVDSLAGFDDSTNELENIKKNIVSQKDLMGPLNQLKTVFPGATASRVFDSQMKLAAQKIGVALEGGKLTDADIERYRQMLPNLADTPDVAMGKIETLQQMLQSKKQTSLTVLEKSNYDVSNFIPQKRSISLPGMTKEAVAAPMPQKVIQNGVEYILNPKTGQYE